MSRSNDPRTILVHDFTGHPFPTDLSRALAADGDFVVHAYCSGTSAGNGDMTVRADDPTTLRFVDLQAEPFERYSFAARLFGELRYGRRAARLTSALQPDVVISSNTPLLVQARFWASAKRVDATRVYWLQDFLGLGVRLTLANRSPLLGATMGRAFETLERTLLRRSHGIVAISTDFLPTIRSRGVDPDVPIAVIENWPSIAGVCDVPKSNDWSRRHGLDHGLVALYSGTLGLKHDPDHLVRAALALVDLDARLVVVTEGLGRQALETHKAELSIDNLDLFDYVDYAELPSVLATADVCLVLLEPDAGVFSVPSKILNYLAAGKPIAAAMPAANLASRTIEDAGAGIVVPPGDHDGFADAITTLLGDGDELHAKARRARDYVDKTFDLDAVKASFRDLMASADARRSRGRHTR